MKTFFSRKVAACAVALVVLCGMFFTVLAVEKAAITERVVIVFGCLIVTVCFAYIGGNVWGSWVKSKYFRSELSDK